MAESKTRYNLNTLALVMLAAVATALLTHWIQVMLWDRAVAGVSWGAAIGVGVATGVARRSTVPRDAPKS